MGDASQPSVSAVVVAFNGGTALQECVASLLYQTVRGDILVVDNASTDGSVDTLERAYGDSIRILRQGKNTGYAAGANAGWRAATTEIVAVLNQDLVLMPDCLERMREVLLASDQEAVVTPKLVLKSDPTRVNAVGNQVHLSGVAWCHGLGTSADDWHGHMEVPAISGAAFMARIPFLRQLGGLEESYFMYMEDVDLSLRARIAGAICLAACDAVVIHDWEIVLDANRFELLERNRGAFWRRFWGKHARMYPLLMQAELMGCAYAVIRGRAFVAAKRRSLRRPKLRPVHEDAYRLVGVFATNHPYAMLFPGHLALGRMGHAIDRIFALSAPPRLSAESRVTDSADAK